MVDCYAHAQFCEWMRVMWVDSDQAASLLKTDVRRVQRYRDGTLFVPPRHSVLCRKLLAEKIQAEGKGLMG